VGIEVRKGGLVGGELSAQVADGAGRILPKLRLDLHKRESLLSAP
jgi:hypothetical protein